MHTKSLLRGVYASFYSKSFYQEVAAAWDGEPFVYLLILLILSAALLGAIVSVGFVRTAKPIYEDLLRQVPVIHVVNGRARAEGPQPLTLKARVRGRDVPIAVIDTGDHFKSFEAADAPIVLTSREFIVLNKGEKRTRSLSQMKDLTVDSAWLRTKMRWLLKLTLAVMIPVGVVFLYGYQLIKSLLYALAGLAWNVFFGARLSFAALWRLSLVAMTPSWLLGLLLFFNKPFRLPLYVYIPLTLAYLGFAVWANIPDEDA